jgi:hypothetical protein
MPERKSTSFRLSEARTCTGAIELAVRFFVRHGLEKFIGKKILVPKRGRPFKKDRATTFESRRT